MVRAKGRNKVLGVESVRVVCISFGCIKGPRMPVKSETFGKMNSFSFEETWCMGGDTPYNLIMFFAKYYSTMIQLNSLLAAFFKK